MPTIKEWVLNQYEPETINDIVTNGINGGFSGMTYYNETVSFHDEYEKEIWEMLNEDAESEGCTIIEFLSHFNCQKEVSSIDQLKNLLAWYAVEKVCQEIVNSDQ